MGTRMAATLYFIDVLKLGPPTIGIVNVAANWAGDPGFTVNAYMVAAEAAADAPLACERWVIDRDVPEAQLQQVGESSLERLARAAAHCVEPDRRADALNLRRCEADKLLGPRALGMYAQLPAVAGHADDRDLVSFIRELPTLRGLRPPR